MDPIIRAADIASVRRLARPGSVAPASRAAAPGPAAVPAAEAVKPVPSLAAVRPAIPGEEEWQALEERTLALDKGEDALRRSLAELAVQQDKLASRAAELAQREQALEAELEDRRAAAEQRGLLAGEAKARAAVEAMQEESQAHSDSLAQQVRKVLDGIASSRAALLAEADDVLVEVVHAALCRMLGENGAARALVATTVAAALREVRDGEPVRVYVHPQDLEMLQGLDGAETDPRVQLLPDAGVVLGGCLVETARGTLDARLDLQMQALRQALMAAREARRTIQVAD